MPVKITQAMIVLAGAAAAGPIFPAFADTCGKPNSSKASACTIDSTIDPLALCNDHSVPAYWFRPGVGAGKTNWVIWLEGGGNCIDPTSCMARAANSKTQSLLTSKGFKPSPGYGVTSSVMANNPALYNANTVVVHYCSSDSWSGTKAQTTSGKFVAGTIGTWDFEGARIAVAAVKSVIAAQPQIASATLVMIGGSSAGGEGITARANDILPLLPAGASPVFVNDAGFALHIGQFDSTAPAPYIYAGHPNAFESNLMSRLPFWGAVGDSVCDAAAKTPVQHATCLDSGYVLSNGFIKVPSFVAESQLDTAQVTDELCPASYGNCQVSTDPASQAGTYATAFASHMAAALQGNGTQAAFTAFSPLHYMHQILNCNKELAMAFSFPGGMMSALTVFDTWLANPMAARVVDIGNAPGVTAAPLACDN